MEEKNSNRGLVVGLIICIIIILLLTGLLAWKFIDNNSDNENTNVDTTEKEETINYDLAEAKKIIDKYVILLLEDNVFERGYDSNAKGYLAYQNVKKNQVKNVFCKDIYSNNKEFTYDEGYGYSSDFGFCSVSEPVEAISYNAMNEAYKELFGSDEQLLKNDISFSISRYDYDEKTSQFISLSCECGGADPNHYGYGVKSATKTGNTLTIDVGYFILEYNSDNDSYSSNLTDKTYSSNEIYKDTFDKEYLNEFKDKIDTYRFTFKYEIDHYVLKDMKKR